nr:trypsin eta-like [Leptinotarsa decemlineata]
MNIIDPRIVTPTGASPLCPTGFFPCYGAATQCGQVFLPPNTTADGPSSFGAYPWQAYLSNATNNFSGSGVLLDSFHVLTAAHKVYLNLATPSAITVWLGVWNPNNRVNVQRSAVAVAGICIHPQFNATTLRNDIAVLTLAQPIVLGIYSNINTVCLATTGAATSYVGQSCRVSGWGQTSFTTFDAPTNPQKQVTVSIVSYETCRASMATLLGNNVDIYLDPMGEICAGGVSMIDACTVSREETSLKFKVLCVFLAGLVIWGKNCGQPGVYGVYVNVPFYYTWIQGILTSTARNCWAG